MGMIRDDHLLMTRLLERTIGCLLRKYSNRSEEILSIANDLRLHAIHLIEVHFPLEYEMFYRIRDKQPGLNAAIEDLILERQRLESWLLTIRSMISGVDFAFREQDQGLKLLITNYCVRKLMQVNQESHWVHPTIEATFSDDDWLEIESSLDQILSSLDKTTPGYLSSEESKWARFCQSMKLFQYSRG